MSFRLEYKRGSASGSSTPTSMFQRQVKMQVDISHISKAESGPEALYAITFTLLSGKNTQMYISKLLNQVRDFWSKMRKKL